jgi:hypothetical protein
VTKVGEAFMWVLFRVVCPVLWVLAMPLWPLFWLSCRLSAEECPECHEDWNTELVGEWGGEDWHCRRCDLTWHVPNEEPARGR